GSRLSQIAWRGGARCGAGVCRACCRLTVSLRFPCKDNLMSKTASFIALALWFAVTTGSSIQSASPPAKFKTSAALNAEIQQFLTRELAAHLSQISTLEPPPKAIHGAGTTGEYNWGTFMRAVAVYREMY